MALEQELGDRERTHRRVGLGQRQQRPAAGDGRRAALARQRRTGAPAIGAGPGDRAGGRGFAAEIGAQRGEGVARDESRPDQVPEGRREHLVVDHTEFGAHGVRELAEEVRAATRERGEDRPLQLGRVVAGRIGEGHGRGVGEVEAHPAVVAGKRSGPRPDHLARRGELVEHDRRVVPHPGGEHEGLPSGCRQRDARKLVDHLRDTIDAAELFRHMLPGREEPSERGRVDRFDLMAQRRERPGPQAPQHLGVTPLAAGAPGSELALDDAPLLLEPAQRLDHDGGADAEPLGGGLHGERRMGARETPDEVTERVVHGHDERCRDADRQWDADGVAEAGRVLDRGVAVCAGAPDPVGARELREPRGHVDIRSRLYARLDLGDRERSEDAQQVDDPLRALHPAFGGEALQLELGLLDDARVEQLAQFGAAEQLGEKGRVERQGGGPALGEGRVALVHEGRDVAEEHRPRERRGLLGLGLDDADVPGLDLLGQGGERGKVVDVLQHLTHGLEHDREARVLDRDREQLRSALALLPEGRTLSGVVTGEQEGPGGALPEPRGEQRGSADLLGDDLGEFIRVEEEQLDAGRFAVGVGDAGDDAVIARHRGALHPVALADARGDGEGPRGVDGHAIGRVEDDAPVAELVAEPLDDEGAVGGHVPGRLLLVVDEGDEVVRRELVEAADPHPGVCLSDGGRGDLTGELADRAAELGGAAEAVALPERHPPGLPVGGGDEHPVVRDVLDAPARGSEGEDVADSGLVDHLLVELADTAPGRALRRIGSDHEDAEEPTVGDGASARHGEALGPWAAGDRSLHAVPDDARAQLGELVGGVEAAEEVEGRVVGAARQVRVGRGAAHGVEPFLHVEGVERHRGDGLLGEHVERIGRHRERLDPPRGHPLARHGGMDEVGTVLREDDPSGDLPDLVPGPAHALEAARDRRRRLDLDDEVDLAHVDAELEGRRRDDAAQPPALEIVLDEGPLVLRHRPVVRAGEQRLGPRRLAGLPHELRGRESGCPRPGARHSNITQPGDARAA